MTDGGESIELIAACCPAPLSACCCSFIRSMPGGGIGGILPSANAAMLSHCQRTISPSSSRLWPCSSMCALVILKYSPDWKSGLSRIFASSVSHWRCDASSCFASSAILPRSGSLPICMSSCIRDISITNCGDAAVSCWKSPSRLPPSAHAWERNGQNGPIGVTTTACAVESARRSCARRMVNFRSAEHAWAELATSDLGVTRTGGRGCGSPPGGSHNARCEEQGAQP